MADLRVNFAGIEFQNPVLVASGTFGFGREYGAYIDLNELGGICVKGLTLKPREGNRAPRVVETPMGMLNSVGLQNPGVDAFIKYELPDLRKTRTKIIANLSGNTVGEYAEMARKLSVAGVDMLEVNISCPNVKEGGLAFGTTPVGAASVTDAVKRNSSVPVMVKLTPNVTDIVPIARAAAGAGADALSLINTLLGMRINYNTRRPMLANNMGGLSGPAILPVAIRMVYQVAAADLGLPILGMGGIMSGTDAVEMMLAGADMVSVGTACFADPQAPLRVTRELDDYLNQRKIDSVTALTRKVEIHT